MNILLKPIISEASMNAAKNGRFSFAVVKTSTRLQIKKAVEKTFGVTVTKIETVSIPAKTYRSGKTRAEKQTTRGKKAIVTLLPGEKIDLFEVTVDA
ncbi:MAG TPA: 50S ribosomal protein L23 [Patescibacteria group bacterium]|nr:50S ribosomal protein L23 [Patescibacteria group bacterium]